jgi:hypothetical protein
MRFYIVLFYLFATLCLSGCDQVRQKIADTLAPPTPVEMVARMDALVDDNKASEAVNQGKDYLKNNKDPQGIVKLALSRAYLAAGDAIAVDEITSIPRVEASVEPAPTKRSPPKPLPPEPTNRVAVDGASVTEGPNGTVVRAGNAVVVMPK